MDEQECDRCGAWVLTLSSRGWCDGCERSWAIEERRRNRIYTHPRQVVRDAEEE